MDHLLSKEKEVQKDISCSVLEGANAQSKRSSFFENQITEDIRDKNMIFLNRKVKDKSRKMLNKQ